MRRLAIGLLVVGFCSGANAADCGRLSEGFSAAARRYVEFGGPLDEQAAFDALLAMEASCGLKREDARNMAGAMGKSRYWATHRNSPPTVVVEPDIGSGVTNCFSLMEGTVTCVN